MQVMGLLKRFALETDLAKVTCLFSCLRLNPENEIYRLLLATSHVCLSLSLSLSLSLPLSSFVFFSH